MKKKIIKKTVKEKKTEKNNPFEIMTDVPVGRALGINDPKLDMLIEQLYRLTPNNKMESVNVPVTLYPTKKDAYNLLRVAKYKIKTYNMADITLTIKTIVSSDSKKSYLGSRIFRLK